MENNPPEGPQNSLTPAVPDSSSLQPGLGPKQRIEEIFEKFEMMAMQQKSSPLNLSTLNDEQKNKLLDVVQKNEDHAFDYYKTKQQNKKEVVLAQIQANNYTNKTNRISVIIILIICFAISGIILVYKDTYFATWLGFLTGLIGGYGLGKSQKSNAPTSQPEHD